MIEEEQRQVVVPTSPTLEIDGNDIDLREKEITGLIERKSTFEKLVLNMQNQQTESLDNFKKAFEGIIDSLGGRDEPPKGEYYKLRGEFNQKHEKLLKSKKEDPDLQNAVDSLKGRLGDAKQEYRLQLDSHLKGLKVIQKMC